MIVSYENIEKPLVNSSGKNSADVLCPKEGCKCVVLGKETATLVERDGSKLVLPESTLPANSLLQNNIDDTHFWHVGNMMDFDNVGFSITVGTTKYLSCADCDLGPIGYHDTTCDPKEYLISIKRAKYRFDD
ncbi:hypothetical protein [Parasitella parasitica]|uniref:Mss4-like protein n=1 Tax=Parasitella parasitica TaxID=35722 RepID=A0A0B7MSK6_9FUNG|nr:hypothetical protein [Parasitella parasitica]